MGIIMPSQGARTTFDPRALGRTTDKIIAYNQQKFSDSMDKVADDMWLNGASDDDVSSVLSNMRLQRNNQKRGFLGLAPLPFVGQSRAEGIIQKSREQDITTKGNIERDKARREETKQANIELGQAKADRDALESEDFTEQEAGTIRNAIEMIGQGASPEDVGARIQQAFPDRAPKILDELRFSGKMQQIFELFGKGEIDENEAYAQAISGEKARESRINSMFSKIKAKDASAEDIAEQLTKK